MPDREGFNRRELLRRGAGVAVGAGAGVVLLEHLADDVPAAGPLRKCLSMGGPGTIRQDGHPDDYLSWGNREYLIDSGTAWVKLWVSWQELQEELGVAPANRAASWNHLNSAPGGQAWLRRMDRQVKAINDDGKGVILTLNHTYPTWSNGAMGADPVGLKKPPEQKIALDLSPNGPWGWFVGYLLARYRKGVARNPSGPREPEPGESASVTRFGNPDGGGIAALEIVNEPNYLLWPQEGMTIAVAQMIRSADELSRTWGGRTTIVAPASSDFPDEVDQVNSRGIVSSAWEGFTMGVLDELRGFRPSVPMRWSHHNYRETRFSEAPRRTLRVVRLLQSSRWRGGDQPLWITEGGFNMGTRWQDPALRDEQARLIERAFRRTMRVREVYMCAQHTISDKQGNSWKGGLRDDFVWGVGLGGTRPAWHTWRDLPGSPLV